MQHTRLRLARVLKMWKRALPAPNCHGESCSLEWCLLTSARRRRKMLGIRGRLGGAENTLKLNLETWFSHKTIPKSVKIFRLRRAKIPKFQIFNTPKKFSFRFGFSNQPGSDRTQNQTLNSCALRVLLSDGGDFCLAPRQNFWGCETKVYVTEHTIIRIIGSYNVFNDFDYENCSFESKSVPTKRAKTEKRYFQNSTRLQRLNW